ncbi:MAG: dihydroorotate dehydrogenase [Candidatus Hadarchaeales archaeon]
MEEEDGEEMSKLSVKIGRLKLRNPIMLAAGILSNGPLLKQAALAGAGAVVTKSLTVEKREGSNTPAVIGVRGGFLNNIGIANPGYVDFLSYDLPIAKEGGVPVIVSVAGFSENEFVKICGAADDCGADAVELNLSCPNVKRGGLEFGREPEVVKRIVRRVKDNVTIPVFVKLGLTDRLVEVGESAQKAGADGVVAINTITGMAIDVHTRSPILSEIYGGLSGPAIHPIALRCVHQLHKRLSIPIVGCGGVETWEDAVEFILAGATAVQVGSAIAVKGLSIFKEICRGIEKYLENLGLKNISAIEKLRV